MKCKIRNSVIKIIAITWIYVISFTSGYIKVTKFEGKPQKSLLKYFFQYVEILIIKNILALRGIHIGKPVPEAFIYLWPYYF